MAKSPEKTRGRPRLAITCVHPGFPCLLARRSCVAHSKSTHPQLSHTLMAVAAAKQANASSRVQEFDQRLIFLALTQGMLRARCMMSPAAGPQHPYSCVGRPMLRQPRLTISCGMCLAMRKSFCNKLGVWELCDAPAHPAASSSPTPASKTQSWPWTE